MPVPGFDLVFLIDTGADGSFVSNEYRMSHPYLSSISLSKIDTGEVKSANDSIIPIEGTIDVEVKLGNTKVIFTLIILQILNQDLILGIDFLSTFSGLIDTKAKIIRLDIPHNKEDLLAYKLEQIEKQVIEKEGLTTETINETTLKDDAPIHMTGSKSKPWKFLTRQQRNQKVPKTNFQLSIIPIVFCIIFQIMKFLQIGTILFITTAYLISPVTSSHSSAKNTATLKSNTSSTQLWNPIKRVYDCSQSSDESVHFINKKNYCTQQETFLGKLTNYKPNVMNIAEKTTPLQIFLCTKHVVTLECRED
jgi:hypothetical protein